jgi:hypothetical protein
VIVDYSEIYMFMVAFVSFAGFVTGLLMVPSTKQGASIGEMLDALLTNHTAIISISKIDETSVCVSIVADWTEYAEQCFFNETLEGALSMAIEHKAKAENRKAGE